MTDFELNIPDDIKSTAWIEADPFNTESLKSIDLYIDWEKKTAEVVTYSPGQGQHVREFHSLATGYTLPIDVDASRFKQYYNERIKPLILAASEKFESFWDGSNLKGRFNLKEEDFYTWDVFGVHHAIENVWKHDKFIFFDVGESFQNYKDIIDVLKYADIDLMTADLADMETIRNIRSYLEDDVLYIMSDEEFQRDIIGIKETIQEEE